VKTVSILIQTFPANYHSRDFFSLANIKSKYLFKTFNTTWYDLPVAFVTI
jgi:hypothetical protein